MVVALREMFSNLAMEFSPKCLNRYGVLLQKPRLLIWIVLNYIVVLGSSGSFPRAILSTIFYVLLIRIALSGFSEKIFRLLEDARRVATQTEKDKLMPLFNEVYEKVKEQSNVSDKIKLYIVDQMHVNAFALGRNTIAVTRGLMSTMSDEQIKGVLAHEFAHIAKGDTQVSMLILLSTNINLFIVLLLTKLLLFFENLIGSNSFFGSLLRFIRTIIETVIKYILWIITLLVSSSSRKMEYTADKYASEIGYREQLISALYKLYDMQVSDKKNLVERIKASHPKLAYRIEALEDIR